jgi:hypothetical protein
MKKAIILSIIALILAILIDKMIAIWTIHRIRSQWGIITTGGVVEVLASKYYFIDAVNILLPIVLFFILRRRVGVKTGPATLLAFLVFVLSTVVT